jgi:four helix bundle suffix protein
LLPHDAIVRQRGVTSYLLAQQIKTLEKEFLEEGGLRERMSQARIEVRKKQK